MTATTKFVGFFLVVLFAEVGASLLLPLLGPTDSPIEAYYSGLFDYEAWRALCWIPTAVLIALLYVFLEQRPGRPTGSSGPARLFSLALVCGLGVETLTSTCYWKSPHSKGVRALYESVWYWHRVPRQTDYGWPSFRGYFLDHLILWGIIFIIGFVVRYLWSRRGRAQISSTTTGQSVGTTP
jgi:hypothetical protein